MGEFPIRAARVFMVHKTLEEKVTGNGSQPRVYHRTVRENRYTL
jgi:hypothetical protein